MTRPLPPPIPPRPALFRQTPPVIFTPVFGLVALGLAWRRGAEVLGFPEAIGEAILGASSLLFLFCLVAYGAKAARRPAVILEDLRILPGRGGLSAASLTVLLVAATAAPYRPETATLLMALGLVLHALLALGYLAALLRAPPEGRRVTPVWHLGFVGFIVGALPAAALGYDGLARAILFATIPVALGIWITSAVQAARMTIAPPLRPLLAIHLAPAALFATVAALVEVPAVATAASLLLLVGLTAVLSGARWLLAAGFTPLWGSLTFPASAAAGALFAQGGWFAGTGAAVLLLASGLVPWIALRVFRAWAGGQLGARTNAAIA